MGQLIGLAASGGQPNAGPNPIQDSGFTNPNGNQSQNWNQGMANMLGATTGAAPQASAGKAQGAQLNLDQYQGAYNQEQGLANQYSQMAQGKGPSLAMITANQQAQAGLNNTLSALGSQSGSSNPALAQRSAIDAGSQASAQAAANAVQGRTAEEMNAMQAQGGLYNAMTGQAAGVAGQNAQLAQNTGQFNTGQQNQMAMANLQAALQNKQINNAQYNQYMNMLQQQTLSQYQAAQNNQQLQVQEQLGAAGINVPAQEWYAGQIGQGVNSLMSTVGAAAMSDQRSKKNISYNASTELDNFLTMINNIMKEKK